MYKIAAIIGGVLLMAGVALAGTRRRASARPSSPTIGQTIPTAAAGTTVRQEDRAAEARPAGARTRPART